MKQVLQLAAALFLSLAGSALSKDTLKPLRAGIIGLDTSHVPAFTKLFNNPKADGDLAGIKVVAGYPGGTDMPASKDRVAKFTEQVRGIVKVVTAVANGDLKQNLAVKSKGEVAALAETINNMIGTLATFADQVTTVAREVGVEGRLGGFYKDVVLLEQAASRHHARFERHGLNRYWDMKGHQTKEQIYDHDKSISEKHL